jgi:hypothetical protein
MCSRSFSESDAAPHPARGKTSSGLPFRLRSATQQNRFDSRSRRFCLETGYTLQVRFDPTTAR